MGDDILDDAKFKMFTCRGADNDENGGNCAENYPRGGFWYKSCGRFRPNGKWLDEANSSPGNSNGIWYTEWKPTQTLKSTEMMI